MKYLGWIVAVVIVVAALVYVWSNKKVAYAPAHSTDSPVSELADDSAKTTPPALVLTTSADNTVVLDQMTAGEQIAPGFTISGTVPDSWVFEGIFPIELRSRDGALMSEHFGTVKWIGDDGEFLTGPLSFTAEINYAAEDMLSKDAYLVLQKNLVADDDQADTVQIPVQVEILEEGQDAPGSLPPGLSHVEAGMVDFASCSAAGGEVEGSSCTTFDGRVFTRIPNSVLYTCDDGIELETTYVADGIEYIEGGQDAVLLTTEVSGSGEQYSNGTITFSAKAGEAFVEVNGEMTITGCQS